MSIEDYPGIDVYARNIPDKRAFDGFCESVGTVFDFPTNPHVVDHGCAQYDDGDAVVWIHFTSQEQRDAALVTARDLWSEPAFTVRRNGESRSLTP